MKHLLAIIVIATLLCSCAAEKRLARFLATHPELHRVDTIIKHDTIIRAAEVSSTTISLAELMAMDSLANAATDTTGKVADPPTVSATTDRSEAAITAKGNQTFELTSTAKPDTIFLCDTVYQPTYVTEYKDREVEVYKQKWWQEILTSIGMIALIIAIIYVIIRTIIKYTKK